MLNIINSNKHMQSISTIFEDLLNYSIHILSHKTIPFLKEDKAYIETIHNLFMISSDVDPYEDAFGDLYEMLSSTNKASALGQFFTPMSVSDLMSRLVLDTVEDKPISCHEPSCGSGRAVLSFMKYYREIVSTNDLHNASAQWWCIDLDPLCVKMTIINCALNSIPAVVFFGDTLSMQLYEAYTVHFVTTGDYYYVPIIVKHEKDSFDQLVERMSGKVNTVYKKEEQAPKEEQVTLFNFTTEEYVAKQLPRIKKNKISAEENDSQLSLF